MSRTGAERLSRGRRGQVAWPLPAGQKTWQEAGLAETCPLCPDLPGREEEAAGKAGGHTQGVDMGQRHRHRKGGKGRKRGARRAGGAELRPLWSFGLGWASERLPGSV